MQKVLPSCQVLVVDDSAVSRKLVEHALESSGHTLLFAKNGEEALELFRKHTPQIVLTDWMLPDFSGLELLEKIRSEEQRESPLRLPRRSLRVGRGGRSARG